MRLRTTAFTLAAVAVLLTTTACATTGRTPAGNVAAPAESVPATGPVIEVRQVQAGVAGVTGQVRAVVYADGTLIRSVDGTRWSTLSLDPAEVTALVDRAAEDGLLDPDVDLGGGRVSDSPWSEVRFTTADGVHELRVEAPDLVGGLTDHQVAARESVRRTVDALLTPGDDQPWDPERALVWVEDGNLLDFEVPPPLWTGSLTLDARTPCVEPQGADLALLDDLLEADGRPRTGIDRGLDLRTEDGNTVRLRVRDLLPHDPGCP